MRRIVAPEHLDTLPPGDPLAIGSRADLRRLNTIMGHAGILTRLFLQAGLQLNPGRRLTLCELAGGDGTLLLSLARRWSALGVVADAFLVDRSAQPSVETRRSFDALGWSAKPVTADALEWLARDRFPLDLILTNLFLHHLEDGPLRLLLRDASARTGCFITCEPRRAMHALAAARLVGLIGCNSVTRHDSVVSVRAGFRGREISDHWPDGSCWRLIEARAGWFSHVFMARRND